MHYAVEKLFILCINIGIDSALRSYYGIAIYKSIYANQ